MPTVVFVHCVAVLRGICTEEILCKDLLTIGMSSANGITLSEILRDCKNYIGCICEVHATLSNDLFVDEHRGGDSMNC